MAEVHERVTGATIDDAVNAVADVWTMAQCDLLMHNSESNMVLTASFINPAVQLWYLVDKRDRPGAARKAPGTTNAPAAPAKSSSKKRSHILTTKPSKLTHQLEGEWGSRVLFCTLGPAASAK